MSSSESATGFAERWPASAARWRSVEGPVLTVDFGSHEFEGYYAIRLFPRRTLGVGKRLRLGLKSGSLEEVDAAAKNAWRVHLTRQRIPGGQLMYGTRVQEAGQDLGPWLAWCAAPSAAQKNALNAIAEVEGIHMKNPTIGLTFFGLPPKPQVWGTVHSNTTAAETAFSDARAHGTAASGDRHTWYDHHWVRTSSLAQHSLVALAADNERLREENTELRLQVTNLQEAFGSAVSVPRPGKSSRVLVDDKTLRIRTQNLFSAIKDANHGDLCAGIARMLASLLAARDFSNLRDIIEVIRATPRTWGPVEGRSDSNLGEQYLKRLFGMLQEVLPQEPALTPAWALRLVFKLSMPWSNLKTLLQELRAAGVACESTLYDQTVALRDSTFDALCCPIRVEAPANAVHLSLSDQLTWTLNNETLKIVRSSLVYCS
jgi:hypothetical protein